MKVLCVLMRSALLIMAFGSANAVPESVSTSPVRKTVAEMTPSERAAHREKVRLLKQRYFGPTVVKAGSMQGTIAIAIVGDGVPESEADTAIQILRKATKLDIRLLRNGILSPDDLATPANALTKIKCNLAIFIVFDDSHSAMLVAPEDRWAIVNVAKLKTGLPNIESLERRLWHSRVRKEIIRAFSLLCGGGASQFAGNVTDIANIEDLDTVQEFVPIDMPLRYSNYLSKIGVTPAYEKTYLQACKEGWAPHPTNAIEQVIWTRVMSDKERGPTKPLTIVPPKK